MQLPTLLPDETLYSRLIRLLMLTGLSPATFLERFFGSRKACVHPYLTGNLDKISELAEDSAIELMKKQTLAPLFCYFLPAYSLKITSGLLSNHSNVSIRACQLACFKKVEALSINYCPICATRDIYEYGVNYWHRSHQIPGIAACSIHNVWLVHVPLDVRTGFHEGMLPSANTSAETCSKLSYRFSVFATTLLERINNAPSTFDLTSYIDQLSKKGYITKGKRVRRKWLSSDFYEFIQLLEHPWDTLLPQSPDDYEYLSRLLSVKVPQHPFKYLLLGFWLSLDYSNRRFTSISLKPPLDLKGDDPLEQECIELLREGLSMAEISRRTGKSRCFVKALALRQCIPIKLQPRTITSWTIKSVKKLAWMGFHRKAIAKRVNISMGSVEQIISCTKGLVDWRKRCKYESTRRRYKVKIKRYLQDMPNAIRQDVKLNLSAAFYWLYLHEKQWLQAALPLATKAKPQARVNWAKRDVALASDIKEIMELYDFQISRTRLDKLLGGHGWLTSKKAKFPVSMKLYYALKNEGCKAQCEF